MLARSRLQQAVEAGLAPSPAVALLGPRQCGKTPLARLLMAGQPEATRFEQGCVLPRASRFGSTRSGPPDRTLCRALRPGDGGRGLASGAQPTPGVAKAGLDAPGQGADAEAIFVCDAFIELIEQEERLGRLSVAGQ